MSVRVVIVWGCLLALTSCRSPVEPDPFNYNGDPVARALGAPWSFEGRQHFDAGFVVRQFHAALYDFRGYGRLDYRAAFSLHDMPAEVLAASVNGLSLAWVPEEKSLLHGKIYVNQADSAWLPVPADSVTIAYADFDGETWRSRIDVAPDFGQLSSVDSINVHDGWTLHYEHPVPGDSIEVDLTPLQDSPPYSNTQLRLSLPDTGAIVIPASELPAPTGTTEMVIQIFRYRFKTYTTPKGKSVGVYSSASIDPTAWPVKKQ